MTGVLALLTALLALSAAALLVGWRRSRALRMSAARDPLTGLANRVVLGSRLDRELQRDPAGTAVLLLDLNRFK